MIKFKTFLHKKVTQKEKELGTPQRTKRFEDMTPGQVEEISRSTAISYLNKAQDKSRYFSDPNRLETRLKSFTLAQKKIGQSKDKPKIMAKNKSKMVAEKDYTAELEAQKKRQEEERNLRGVLERHYPDNLNHSEVGDFVNDSSMINHHHWEVHKGTRKSSDRIFPYDEKENHISETIDKLTHSYKTPQAMTVWSKSRHDPRILKNNEGIVHHPAFLSTSLKKSVAEQTFQHRNVQKKDEINHHHVLKINVPEGKHGYYVNNDYNEFVLPRGTNLKYHSTDTHGDSKNIYHTHHMEVI